MKVSIITVAYNSAGTIMDTLTSVQEQRYSNIEHIIVDGASTDDTVKIIREIAPNAICISESDEGLYDAMNKGLAIATGDVIGILNSDDFYSSPDVISSVVSTLISSNADTLYGNLIYVDANNTGKSVRKWRSGKFKKSNFIYGWMPPHPTFFVRKAVYHKYGDFRTELKSSADYELMLRFLYKHNVSTIYLPEYLVRMRAGGQSNASLGNRLKANKEDRLAWKLNGIDPMFYTTWLKPMRKILQFVQG